MINQLLCNTSSHGGSLKDAFNADIKKIQSLQIATGYFGESLITELEAKLVKVARNGGSCKILIGMVFHKGVSAKQRSALESIDSKLRSTNPENGIYISQKEYHGKIYLLNMEANDVLYIGSSNFSSAGFKGRLEATLRLEDIHSIEKTSGYLDYLFGLTTTSKLDEVSLVRTAKPIKETSSLLEDYKIDCSLFPDESRVVGTFEIELRVDVQKESSLNLYFGAGRKNAQGKFVPRPWYEIELSVQKSERESEYYPMSVLNGRRNSRLGAFTAYIKDSGICYKIEMKVHSDYGKNISSSDHSGGRQTLGRYIKGKLEVAGVLKFAERITSEMLYEYGKSSITFKKIDDRTYILEF